MRALLFLLAPVLVVTGLYALPRAPNGRADAGVPLADARLVHAGSYMWKPVQIGGGGFLTGQSSDLKGIVRVVRTDVHGAYLWDAAKDRWEQLVTAEAMPAALAGQGSVTEGAYEVAVAPSDPDRLYLAIAGAVFVSRDRGRHFVRAWADGPALILQPTGRYRFYGPFIWVDPRAPDRLLLGTPEQGLWRSEDAGAHWQQVDAVPPSQVIEPGKNAKKPQRPGIVLMSVPGSERVWAMSGGNGIFASEDGGRSFHPLPATGAKGPAQLQHGVWTADGTFLGADPVARTLWRYRKGVWEDIGQGVTGKPRAFATLAVNPADNAVYLFDGAGKGFRSADEGDSWRPLLRRVVIAGNEPRWLGVIDHDQFFGVSSAQFDPRVPGRLWATSGTGVYYADLPPVELWLSWTSQTRGIEELVANDAIAPKGGVPLFAGWDFGIHRKPDLDVFSDTWGPKPRSLISAQQMDWSPADPAFIVTNASDTRMGCCTQDGQSILAGYSMDGGQSWTRFPTLPVPPGTTPGDPWAMSFGTIAVSSGDTRNIVWEPSFNRSPFYTLDRGQSWARVTLPGEVLPFTGSHAIYTLSRRTLAADRVTGGRFYLVHSGEGANRALQGLWRTEDGGQNWHKVFSGEIAPMSGFSAKLRAVPGKAGHLFFTTGLLGGPDTRLRRSVDGGVTWSALDDVTVVDDVAFGKAASGADYPAIYLSGKVKGQYGIWRSLDSARSWQRIAGFPEGRLDRVTVVAADLDHFGRVYLGYMGTGWLYGDPSDCAARPLARDSGEDCEALAAP